MSGSGWCASSPRSPGAGRGSGRRRRPRRGWPPAGGRIRRSARMRGRWRCSWSMSAIPATGGSASASSAPGAVPVQVFHERNTAAHVCEHEGRAERRRLTRAELQAFFDAADDHVEKAAGSRRKGWLASFRDATLFKVIYGWGLFSRGRPVRWRLTSRVCAAQRLLGETLPAATGVVQRSSWACHWGRPGWLSWVMSSLLAARAAARSSSRSSSWSFRSRTCCSR
jgi:hypothetical protein